ncbi:hypothetical protein JVW08_20105, partial [Vibrio cholerae O1]|uniref:hypothetical protein n=1 Tax=Vibrio cholerae TaxID=666 RepID=UPI001C122E4F
ILRNIGWQREFRHYRENFDIAGIIRNYYKDGMTTFPFEPTARLRATQAVNTDASATGGDEPLPRSSIESTYQRLRVDIVHARH